MAYRVGGVYGTVSSTDSLLAYSPCGYQSTENCWRVDDDTVTTYYTSNHSVLRPGTCSNASDPVWGTKYFENCTDHPKLVTLLMTFALFDSDGTCSGSYPYSWSVRWHYKNQSFILDAHTCACLPYTEHTPAMLKCCTDSRLCCPILMDWRVQFSPLFVPVNYPNSTATACLQQPADPYWESSTLCLPVYNQTNNVISLTCCSGWGKSNPSCVNLTSNTLISYSPCTITENKNATAIFTPTYTAYDSNNICWTTLRSTWSNLSCICNQACLAYGTCCGAMSLKYKSDTGCLKSPVLGSTCSLIVFNQSSYSQCPYSTNLDARYAYCAPMGYIGNFWAGLAVRASCIDNKLVIGKVSCIEEV